MKILQDLKYDLSEIRNAILQVKKELRCPLERIFDYYDV